MAKAMDLIGKKYGRLTVVEIDEERTKEKKRKYWLCKCECGTIKSVDAYKLKIGETKSCGCLSRELTSQRSFKDLTGLKFGLLIVKKLDEVKTKDMGKTYWVCECECGVIKSISASHLQSGNTISCGCNRLKQSKKFNDLTNMRFGRLIAKERVFDDIIGRHKWKCVCDCGNITYVEAGNLTAKIKPTLSCGCVTKEVNSGIRKDIIGKRFGRWTVIGEDYESKQGYTRFVFCRCDCGVVKSVRYGNLISNNTYSCGCLNMENITGENNYNWKGGITPLSRYLREHIQEWKVASLKNANYKCLITNTNKDLVIHHIYPFNKILKETLEELNMPTKEIISDYSKEDLELIESKFLENHFKYGYGAVMEKELHIEFHSIYGTGNYGSEHPEFEEWEEFYNNKVIC